MRFNRNVLSQLKNHSTRQLLFSRNNSHSKSNNTVEEVLDEGLNLGDTGGTTDQDDLVDLGLGHLGVGKDILHRLQSLLEEIRVQSLELGTGQSLLEVLTVEEGLNTELHGRSGGQSTLGLLDFTTKLMKFS